MRLAALRKLQEVGSPATLLVAESLATSTSRSAKADWLRKSSLLAISADKSAAGRAALERLKASSIENAILGTRLERKNGGR